MSSDNLRGSLLMVLAMLGFAIEDMFIKFLAGSLPVGQILLLLGAGGAAVFSLYLRARRIPVITPDLLHPAVMLRNLFEIVGTFGFVTAIALIPISTASTILQAAPLFVTMGAALFLGETVGWRRWAAIAVGFAGVILVLRPGFEGFDPLTLYAVLGVVFLSLRDLASRRVPAHVLSLQLAVWGFATLVPLGATVLWVSGQPLVQPNARELGLVAAVVVIGVFAYYALVAASRAGEVSVVAPFRYSRIVFAMIVGVTVFSERPDALTLLGAAIIVGSGLYTLLREARLRRTSQTDTPAL
jgi:drug/metabolite transporter (DMT)-like permease